MYVQCVSMWTYTPASGQLLQGDYPVTADTDDSGYWGMRLETHTLEPVYTGCEWLCLRRIYRLLGT